MASPAGYIWDNCARHGVTFRSYGEGSIVESSPEAEPTMDLAGSLLGHVAKDWPKQPFVKSATTNASITSSTNCTRPRQTGSWPQFMIMSLGEDHTEGLLAECIFARCACGQQRLGDSAKIVEAVSRSKFWAETAIFVIEDDAQNGPDHVDAHRTVGLVISP